jgi:drug/metabolite transporter (DMT)-like permease
LSPGLWGVITALSWGGSDFTARFVSHRIGHLAALLGTLVVGAALLSLYAAIDASPLRWAAASWTLVLIASVGLLLGTFWLYEAIGRGPVSIVAPIASCYPALVVALALAFGARPGWVQWLGMLLVTGGGIVIARSTERFVDHGQRSRRALRYTVLVAFGSAVAFSASVFAAQRLVPDFGNLHTAWITRLISLGLLLAVLALSRAWPSVPHRFLPWLGLQGALDSGGYLTLYAGSAGADAHIAAVTSSAYGGVTTVLAWLFLGERVGAAQWLGIALIVVGVAVKPATSTTARRPARAGWGR